MFDSDNYRRRKRRPRDQQSASTTNSQDPMKLETACHDSIVPNMTNCNVSVTDEDVKVDTRYRNSLALVADDSGDTTDKSPSRPLTASLEKSDLAPEIKDSRQHHVIISSADTDTGSEDERDLPGDSRQPCQRHQQPTTEPGDNDEIIPKSPQLKLQVYRKRPHCDVTSSPPMSRKAKQFTIEQILGLSQDRSKYS